MIHIMVKASIRDLRTKFPRVRVLIEREGEVVITDRGKPILVLRTFETSRMRPSNVDYYARLRLRQPRPISAAASRALHEDNRGGR